MQICKEMQVPTESMAPEHRGTLLAQARMISLKSKSDPWLEFSLGCDSHRTYFKCLVWEQMTFSPLHLAYLSCLFSHLSSTLNPALLGMNLPLSLLQVCKNARLFQSNLLLSGFISCLPPLPCIRSLANSYLSFKIQFHVFLIFPRRQKLIQAISSNGDQCQMVAIRTQKSSRDPRTAVELSLSTFLTDNWLIHDLSHFLDLLIVI